VSSGTGVTMFGVPKSASVRAVLPSSTWSRAWPAAGPARAASASRDGAEEGEAEGESRAVHDGQGTPPAQAMGRAAGVRDRRR